MPTSPGPGARAAASSTWREPGNPYSRTSTARTRSPSLRSEERIIRLAERRVTGDGGAAAERVHERERQRRQLGAGSGDAPPEDPALAEVRIGERLARREHDGAADVLSRETRSPL